LRNLAARNIRRIAGAACHMPPRGNDEALAIGYLFLLQRLLEHSRYRTDRGYTDAAGLIANFQADVVAQIEAGHIDLRMLAFVEGALRQSRIGERCRAAIPHGHWKTITFVGGH
jgi:hypothetical protein